MIRDADGHPIALPLAKLPSVPLAADVSELQWYLGRAPDPLTAQALLRRYVDDKITANIKRPSLSVDLDAATKEFPQWAHQVAVTRQIYNLPPYDIARRTRANVRRTYPECTCVKCAKPVTPRSSPRKGTGEESESQSQSARSISGRSNYSEGSSHTNVSFFDVEDPPPPYSSTA